MFKPVTFDEPVESLVRYVEETDPEERCSPFSVGDSSDALQAIRRCRHIGGRGAHIVVEAVGRSETIFQAIDIAHPRGNLVFLGLPPENNPIPFSYARFLHKQLQMFAVVGAQGEDDLSSFQKALGCIARRQIDVTQMFSHRLALEDVDEALLLAHERDEDALKVTLTF